MLLFTFYLIVSMFLVGDEKVQLDTVLNDPAFQVVWNHLEQKGIPKEYVIKMFWNSEIKIHPKIINSFNNKYIYYIYKDIRIFKKILAINKII